jgi:hypothetical protein
MPVSLPARVMVMMMMMMGGGGPNGLVASPGRQSRTGEHWDEDWDEDWDEQCVEKCWRNHAGSDSGVSCY